MSSQKKNKADITLESKVVKKIKTSQSSNIELQFLANEVFKTKLIDVIIFRYISISDLGRISRVNTRLNWILKDQSMMQVWREKIYNQALFREFESKVSPKEFVKFEYYGQPLISKLISDGLESTIKYFNVMWYKFIFNKELYLIEDLYKISMLSVAIKGGCSLNDIIYLCDNGAFKGAFANKNSPLEVALLSEPPNLDIIEYLTEKTKFSNFNKESKKKKNKRINSKFLIEDRGNSKDPLIIAISKKDVDTKIIFKILSRYKQGHRFDLKNGLMGDAWIQAIHSQRLDVMELLFTEQMASPPSLLESICKNVVPSKKSFDMLNFVFEKNMVFNIDSSLCNLCEFRQSVHRDRMIRFLIDKKADMNYRSWCYDTNMKRPSAFQLLFKDPLDLPRKELILYLLESKANPANTTFLSSMCSAYYIDEKLLEEIIKSTPPISQNNSYDEDEEQQIEMISLCNNPKSTLGMFKMLVNHGAQFNDEHLFLICKNHAIRSEDIIKFALENNASVSYTEPTSGNTVLHSLFETQETNHSKNLIDLIQLLIRNGANKLNSNKKGDTFIHTACRTQSLAIIKRLVGKFEELLGIPNLDNCKPIHLIFSNPLIDTSYLLDCLGRISENEIERCLKCYSTTAAPLLIYKDIYNKLPSGAKMQHSPLHKVCKYSNDLGVIEFLLENGYLVNYTNEKGLAPIHYSAMSNSSPYAGILFLFKKGANVNLVTPIAEKKFLISFENANRNCSPMDLCLENENISFKQIESLFYQTGMKTNVEYHQYPIKMTFDCLEKYRCTIEKFLEKSIFNSKKISINLDYEVLNKITF